MDAKSKEIYEKIENFLEERKGRDRRAANADAAEVNGAAVPAERRKKQGRRASDR